MAWRTITAVGALPLLLVGCKHAPPTSRSQFQSQATSICDQVNSTGRDLSPAPDPTSQLDYLQAQLQIYATGFHQIEALTQPPKDKARLQTIFREVNASINELNAAVTDQLAGNDNKASTEASQAATSAAAANKSLSSYGLPDCEEN